MDELRPFKCDSGQIYLFPQNHCVFCDHCTDLFYDYTNGPYAFSCDLELNDHETCGQFKEEVMPAEKYLSIITNFGCHFKCPYCVVKNNDIKVPFTTIESLDHLKASVESEGATIISVSGGGDPLHNYSKHRDYYNKLFALCEEMNVPLEMHTSYIDSEFPYEKCYRVVYHLRDFEQLKQINRHGNEIVRAVYVVTEDFSVRRIDSIAHYVHRSNEIDELSFRQMIDKNYQVTHYCEEYLRKWHKGPWWYIEQNDYNTYFVNGKLYYKFSDIGNEV